MSARARELSTDVLIVGGGTGGIAAAHAIARNGGNCIVTEPTDWIGGQLTSQGVPPDENRWIEGDEGVQSATRSYLSFRAAVRARYHDHGELNDAAKRDPRLNPGNGWVSHLCFNPSVGHAVMEAMCRPHFEAARIAVLHHVEPVGADLERWRVRAVRLRDLRGGEDFVVRAQYFLDATECGDLLPLAKVEYAVGAEGRHVHGELHARADKTDPYDQQAISWCFAVEHRAGENHIIDRPANYDFWRNYVPPLRPAWPGKLFSWTVIGGDDHKPRTFRFVPPPDQSHDGELEMWRYRRVVDSSVHARPADFPDVSLINMVQMDYFQKPTLDVSPEQRAAAFAAAREQSRCFLYWMQTDAPRHDSDTKTGYPGLKLRGDVLGMADGFAKHPYIREARRLRARTVVTEAHVGVEQRNAEGRPDGAEPFFDSVGIGHYRLDLHPSTAMRNSIYVDASPFRIPLGALIPVRVRNLLAAGKNLAVTHITNGCYRLHPLEWNVGEAAGLLALHCLRTGLEPHQVHERIDHVRDFQSHLRREGIPLAWPWENDRGL
jgi:hypothetical protein